jgi:hypothetical protein
MPEEILYAFTSGAVTDVTGGRRNLAIVGKWTSEFYFPSGIVFFRTRDGLYRSYVRALWKFARMVPAPGFEMVSKSVLANLRAVDSIDLGNQRIKTLSYAVEESEFSWPLELVVVRRDYLKRIRSCFAMPPRVRTGPSSTGQR